MQGISEFQRDEKRCGGGCRINQPPSVPTNANAPARIKDEESMHTAQSVRLKSFLFREDLGLLTNVKSMFGRF